MENDIENHLTNNINEIKKQIICLDLIIKDNH